MRFFPTLLFLFAHTFSAFGQITTTEFPPLKIGEWRQHLPWQRANYVTQSDSKVYYSTEWSVVEIDKADRSPRFLTKVEGLSDAGMGVIKFNKASNTLVLCYANSNIDLWNAANGSVINLPFISNNINLTGDKKIYDVVFDGKFAYLACGFGVVKLNLERAETEYTTFTGMPVYAFAIYKTNLYAGTEDGLFRLPVDDINPADFGRWQNVDNTVGLPNALPVDAMAVQFNDLYLGVRKALYRFNGDVKSDTVGIDANLSVNYLSAEGAGLMIGWRKDFQGRVTYREFDGAQYEINYPCEANIPNYGIEDGSKKFWFADATDDFRFYDAVINQCDRFSYNSPYQHRSSEIRTARGKVFVATPGAKTDLTALYDPTGVYIYQNDQWDRFNGTTNPELTNGGCNVDLWRVAPSEREEKFYVGSFVGGLVEASGDGASTKCYTQNNSILQNAGISGASRTAIGGMEFDASGNLWICNYDAASPIAVLKPDGTMRNFSAAPANNLLQVAVDGSGYKWFMVGFNGGVMVYDSGQDLDSPADDRYRILNTTNSVLPTNTVNYIRVDLEGDVWVGTQQGVVSFECGSNVFDTSCKGSRRIVTVDDFNGYLLETEDVRCIAVDGANRKWFGTNNGIFVQSPTGEIQEGRFTSTNSPLFDNSISAMGYDGRTGEMWIGTEKGMISVRTEATTGGVVNSDEPYAYPNPVRPGYDGPIAIYGLARDANIKITDVAGNLVYEGQALGGQAVWDGRDYLGRRAASGVYLVMATSQASFDDPDAIITKIVLLH